MSNLPIDFNDENVREVLLELVPASYRTHGIAFVGGSLVEGFGNKTSDIDIVVLTDVDTKSELQGSFSTSGGTLICVERFQGIRVDIELIRRRAIDEVASLLVNGEFGLQAQLDFPYEMLNCLQCLRVGRPLNRTSDFQSIHDRFPWGELARLLANRADNFYMNAVEDAIGAIKSKDLGTSVLTSRLALGFAVDAFTAASGSTNIKPKWRFRKLEALRELEVGRRYLFLETSGANTEEEIFSQCKNRLALAQELQQLAHERLASL